MVYKFTALSYVWGYIKSDSLLQIRLILYDQAHTVFDFFTCGLG